MGSFTGYVVIYVLGGVTFIPLVFAILFLHAYLTLKPASSQHQSSSSSSNTKRTSTSAGTSTASVSNQPHQQQQQQPQQHQRVDNTDGTQDRFSNHNHSRQQQASLLSRPSDDQFSLKSGTDVLAEKFHRVHDSDVAAGYFAVCREYVPGGVNGKPPERTTPAGEVVGTESQSPSVYQSMYRSIFERKPASASIEPGNANGGRNFKKARNVFYIVLRYSMICKLFFRGEGEEEEIG